MKQILKTLISRRGSPALDARTVVRPSPDVLTARADGAAVLLDFGTEQFMGLDDAASTIWAALESGGTLESAVDALAAVFDAERAQLEGDARRFVEDLMRRRLLVAA